MLSLFKFSSNLKDLKIFSPNSTFVLHQENNQPQLQIIYT